MNKRLFIVLLVITALMVGGLGLSNDNAKKESAKGSMSLSDMVGKPALDFNLTNQKGQSFNMRSLRGKKVVLFFNEGIMCYPACWNQMAALGTDEKLNNNEVVSFSIVTDDLSQWESAFRKMPELNKGHILFDADKTVSNQYGMLTLESSMHKGDMPGHTYIIIDANGIVRYTLDDPNMGVQNETLIKELSKIK